MHAFFTYKMHALMHAFLRKVSSEDDIYEQLSGTWVVIWKGHFASSEGLS